MFKRKTLLSLLVFITFALILSACAPERDVENVGNNTGGQESSDTEVGTPEKPDSLLVWINDEDIAEDVSLEIFERYTEETGIEVEYERVALPDQLQELALAGPTGDGPDLFFQPQDRLGDAVTQGLAVPFNYTDEELNGFSEAAIDAFTYEGEI